MRKTFGQRIGSVLLSLAVAAIVFIGSGFDAFAAQTGTVIKDDVKVRESASTTSTQVSSLKKGDTVDILEESNDDSGYVWYKIKIKNGEYGYVRSDLVEKSGGSSSTGDGGGNTTTSTGGSQTATIIPDSATIRQGAGKDYDSVGKASKGETVTIVGTENGTDGKTWYKITYGDGKEGYIRSDLVSENAAESTENLEETVPVDDTQGTDEFTDTGYEDQYTGEETYDDMSGGGGSTEVTSADGDGKYKLIYTNDIWYLAIPDKKVQVQVDQLVDAGMGAEKLQKKVKTFRTVATALGGLAGLLLIIVIVLIIKLRDSMYYEDDDEDEDDEDDDDEYEYSSKKRSKKKGNDSGSKSSKLRRRKEEDEDDEDEDEDIASSRVVSPKRTVSAEGDPIARRPSASDMYTPTKRPSASDMYATPSRRPSADDMDFTSSRRPSADDMGFTSSARRPLADDRSARSSRTERTTSRRRPEEDYGDRYSSRSTEERSVRSSRRDEGYSFEDVDDTPKRRAKNFLGDDDDFEFEFLDLDDDK